MKASDQKCRARILGVCQREGQHLHHRKLRSQGGDDSNANLIPLCHACHHWVHMHPEDSYEMGLLVHEWDDPAEVPIIKYGRSTSRRLGDAHHRRTRDHHGPSGGGE